MKRLKLTEELIRKRYGLLETSETSIGITFHYMGNMGNTVDSIKECFDHIYPDISFDRLLGLTKPEPDDPSYIWSLGPIKWIDFYGATK